MDIKYKLWFEKDGKLVLGDGLYNLLILIKNYGSINQAALASNMSYRQAWGKIKKAEDRLGYKLLLRKKGGEYGGGAVLTKEGLELIKIYEEILKRMDNLLEEFKNIFKEV
ncbi:winged helix-turn-helix domain-containing protein [Thermovenabulum gondwanense]|uniref:HTH lysR-type domain-containing protein n=1 Tax=Thermovenabulum gondwanense TaxID=520767 RepID=A0A162N425_9FIRM|nr:LysR family transcriptional regulator [Thermovenabulum gondwanense]KYO69180.1 hypothetical protein ATZ99_00530 [Thermovenabulum gondwanense]